MLSNETHPWYKFRAHTMCTPTPLVVNSAPYLAPTTVRAYTISPRLLTRVQYLTTFVHAT